MTPHPPRGFPDVQSLNTPYRRHGHRLLALDQVAAVDVRREDVGNRINAIRERLEVGIDAGRVARCEAVPPVDQHAVRIQDDRVDEGQWA